MSAATSTNTYTNGSHNTFKTSSTITSICKQCSHTINQKATIYKGFDCVFCSNYCRAIFSEQIFKKDCSLIRHELWFN